MLDNSITTELAQIVSILAQAAIHCFTVPDVNLLTSSTQLTIIAELRAELELMLINPEHANFAAATVMFATLSNARNVQEDGSCKMEFVFNLASQIIIWTQSLQLVIVKFLN
jgi:hypothetical protein